MAAAWVGRLPAASTLPMNSITASDNLHGFAKFVVVKKPAKPARKGINPFTKLEQMFKAKPARKVIKIRALKALKEMAK